jgi:hypothetical protein
MDHCKSTLSAPRQKLLGLMRQMYFGKIEDLVIQGKEPSFDPTPRITQEIKLGIDGGQLPAEGQDFALKRSVTDLFGYFDRLGDGSVVTIEIRHGLPARLLVSRSV